MNLSGAFSTTANPADLAGVSNDPHRLAGVTSLRDVSLDQQGRVSATFTATTPLGSIPFATIITTDHADESSARVLVHGTRGQHRVDIELELTYTASASATEVTWDAAVQLGGAGASVAQRVAHDIARNAIHSVLQHAADQS
jgi:carbon monoxide dehydrogenase subunit G